MLNFNTNIQEVINTQATTSRAHSFCEYNSKKKLLGANILTSEQAEYITKLKNTFTFYLHEGHKYLVVTMYYSTTKTYGYLVINLETLMCAECESVKIAKQSVLEIIQDEKQETTQDEVATTTQDETTVNTDEVVSEKTPKSNKKSK